MREIECAKLSSYYMKKIEIHNLDYGQKTTQRRKSELILFIPVIVLIFASLITGATLFIGWAWNSVGW
jgi:hypothetical protein